MCSACWQLPSPRRSRTRFRLLSTHSARQSRAFGSGSDGVAQEDTARGETPFLNEGEVQAQPIRQEPGSGTNHHRDDDEGELVDQTCARQAARKGRPSYSQIGRGGLLQDGTASGSSRRSTFVLGRAGSSMAVENTTFSAAR